MKIIIISGFLGAGKTTFIKEMLENLKKRFVILENEFGELNIDGQLLKTDNNLETDIKIWELTDGCICCSTNLDFTYSILTIANTLNPDYLIIEPSGIAWTSRIIKQLTKISYEHIQIAPPITIIDGVNYFSSQKHFPDYLQDQLSVSGTIVVSKSENFTEKEFFQLKEELKLNPSTELTPSHYRQWNKETWEKLLEKEMIIKEDAKTGYFNLLFKQPLKQKKESLSNISIKNFNLKNIETLDYILFLLTANRFGQITRVKGYCKIAKQYWVKFDLIESQYFITGIENMPDERAVIIGKNMNEKDIVSIFQYPEHYLI